MGIYIHGMEMPDVEHGVRTINIYADGVVTNYAEEIIGKAVLIPPHGRLIDADKIGLTDFEIILCKEGNPFKNALEMLLEKIENAPTIIPASEEGE